MSNSVWRNINKARRKSRSEYAVKSLEKAGFKTVLKFGLVYINDNDYYRPSDGFFRVDFKDGIGFNNFMNKIRAIRKLTCKEESK